MQKHSRFAVIVVALTLAVAHMDQPAARGDITVSSGFDLFETVSPTFDNLGPSVTPSIVSLKGVPDLGLGDTDTIIHATGSSQTITSIGGIAIFDLQLYAVHLASVAPVTIGGFSYNLDVKGGTFYGQPETTTSPGITLTATSSNGGTFVSKLDVSAILTFTPVGSGEPSVPPMSFSDTLTGSGLWSATPRSDDAHNASFPSGGFYPGVDPATGSKSLIVEQGITTAIHSVLIGQQHPVPEPSTWIWCVAAGLAAPAYARWRRTCAGSRAGPRPRCPPPST
jgi:hypothetical protein